MNLFKRNTPGASPDNQSGLAEIALKAIHDAVIMTNKSGVIQFVNPAAVTMLDCGSADKAIGLDYGLLIKLESKEGREFSDAENPLIQAMQNSQPLDPFQACLISGQSAKRIPVSISVLPVDGLSQNRIITFRDITKELEEEGEQTEFISTASHEMRTPVATIDGYLSLTLNPQTATIDERARGYLTAAQNASKHLGKLFQDLLDITKLDDGKIRPHFVPVEMVEMVKTISDDYVVRAKEAGLHYTFGSDQPLQLGENRRMEQVVYGSVDMDFMREVIDNLIENAIKYTPSGGSIYVNVRGDGDRVLINVTDTGIGISADDLAHIFQKFYRVDNSDTRTIGGTGLGLYLVKQRVEAMGGRVWAESAFGEGSTFFVSLPRITADEYEKRMIMVRNQQQMMAQANASAPQPAAQPGFQPISQFASLSADPQNQFQNPAYSPLSQSSAVLGATVVSQAVSQSAPAAQSVPATQPAPAAQPTPAPQPALATQPAAQPTPPPVASPAPQPVPIPQSQPASSPLTAPPAVPPPAPPAPPASNPGANTSQVKEININLNGETK